MTFANAVAAARRREPDALAMLVALRGEAKDEDLAELALALAESGQVLGRSERRADVASTGGPTSLTTLLSPIWLSAAGAEVPALAVAGRPAGGIDAVGTLENYRVNLNSEDIEAVLGRCRYAHFLAGSEFAPLDAELFTYRQQHGAQASAPLAIASLLSKKIAVGVDRVGLDVRVARHGNFGQRPDEAEANAHRFRRVAELLGIHARCWLTDASLPYQPWIGRGETLAALHLVLTGGAGGELASHAALSMQIAEDLCPGEHHPSTAELVSQFSAHLEAQGSSWEAFERRALDIRAVQRRDVLAESDGFVTVDLGAVRSVLVREQASVVPAPGAAFPDPAGVVLAQAPGAWARASDVLARVRADDARLADLTEAMSASVGCGDAPPAARFMPRLL